MTKSVPFTQAQIKRAIVAAKAAGLRIVGIRPDGTVIVYDGEEPVEAALRSALGVSGKASTGNSWDDILDFDNYPAQDGVRPPVRATRQMEVPLVGQAYKQHLEKWKEWIRQRPLGVLEQKALKELFAIKGKKPRYIKGAGPGTMERLEARGYVRPVGETKPDRFPYYEITPDGEIEWQT